MKLNGDNLPWRLGEQIVVYGGDETQERSKGKLLSWSELDRHDWTETTG